ncbi:MAG: BTAD domain-containing putative transcriptional regulator, partial [Armatimonadota bacterium]
MLHLFGPLEASGGGMSLLYGMSLYARWLFALLVWQREKPRTRIWLAETLWPDYPPEDEEKRSANFRQQLRTLRHALGKEVSRLSEWDNLAAPALSLDLTGAYVDVFAFERAYRRATSAAGTLSGLEGVVRLYRGEFLEGYQAPWVEEPRRRFQEYYLDALERLAAGTLAAGDAAQAEQWLRQAVETDRFRESAVRQLL